MSALFAVPVFILAMLADLMSTWLPQGMSMKAV
jgi:hypothetical protein